MTTYERSARAAGMRRGRRALAAAACGLLPALGLTPVVLATAVPAASATTVATPAAATPAGQPAGKLTPRGCAASGTSDTCDLYASNGTTAINSQAIPVWSFTTDGSAPSLAVGPTLVVTEGDSVTLNVHNNLPAGAGNLSLSIPGIPNLASDMSGVAQGGAKAYAFTASRAGTYLYQAGHTANGGRQAQMGLVGALVVLAKDGTAYGKSYNDDAVLVLSEVDPAFAANPMGADLRSFSPKYQLINGKSFPETDPLGTDQGHTVLLRYVNAGSRQHWMTLLGGEQTILAEDAHPVAHPGPEVTPTITEGESMDALVSVPGSPTTPDARYTLFEDSQHLDSAGANVAGATQLGFGGMMTYLDTNAPAPSTDQVGPAVTKVAFSQNPVPSGNVTVTVDASDAKSGGNAVDQIEYMLDDPTTAVGSGTALAGIAGDSPTVTAAADINVDGLAGGKHKVYVRAHDVQGNWGVVSVGVLNVAKNGPVTTYVTATPNPVNNDDVALEANADDSASGGTVTAAKYIVDPPATLPDVSDPAWQTMTPNRQAAVVSLAATVKTADLGEGEHVVLVRAQDSFGVWGPPQSIDPNVPVGDATRALRIGVDRTGPDTQVGTIDPAVTNGAKGSVDDPDSVIVKATVSDSLNSGVSSGVSDAEGFIDTRGDDGSGFPLIPISGSFDGTTPIDVYGSIPLSEITALGNGTHHILVHGKDGAGNWGPTGSIDLVVDKAGPAITGLKATQPAAPNNSFVTLTGTVTDPEPASGIAAVEYWLDKDPGVGLGKAVNATPTGNTGVATATIDVRSLPAGNHTFGMRARDLAGNWGAASSTTLRTVLPTEIWSDTFDSQPLAWTGGSVGGVAIVTPPGTVTGTSGTVLATAPRPGAPAYVVDTNPIGLVGFTGNDIRATFKFLFNPGNMRTPAGGTTILAGLRNGNGQAFSLEYRRTALNAPEQFRVTLNRTIGGAVSSSWVNLPNSPNAGTNAVTVVWRGGLLGGSLTATVGTAPAATVTFQTLSSGSGFLDAVRFGPSAGVGFGSAGTAYFDSYVATRQ